MTDCEKMLILINLLIERFIKHPDDLEKYGALILKQVELERKIEDKNMNPPHKGVCISPDWESIGNFSRSKQEKNQQNLSLELELIRLSKVKRQTKAKHKKGSKFSVMEVIEKAGIQHKRGFIKCCFHNENNPSLRIYINTNTFYCFGCGRYGNAYDLAKALGVKT